MELATRLGLRKPNEFAPLWVLDFPLLEWDEETKRYHAMHHPFTSPKPEDFDLRQTAIRETYEEIGVHPSVINVVCAFTEVYIPPSNYMVYPFLGYSQVELDFELQVDEVAGIVELSLKDFLDDKIIVTNTMKTSYAGNIEVPGFQVNEHFVWGATAMMLSELKDVLKVAL